MGQGCRSGGPRSLATPEFFAGVRVYLDMLMGDLLRRARAAALAALLVLPRGQRRAGWRLR
jgi:hypothetical protein